jgi:leucyl-tRNA synthetase
MKLYPEKSRQQFDYVIDWLNDWACTREEGLGTRLPWDEHWLIESLSDSTFYNAYYTITHILKEVPETHITDELFDYIFLGKGKAKEPAWQVMRDEYNYWYPVDFRNSGKDLIQNHLAFMLFTHAALVDEDKWPKGYGVNGHVTVDGQKMSKSLGNVILVRDLVAQYGADASRITILNGGEGLDDANWDSELARVTKQKLFTLLDSIKLVGQGRTEHSPLDDWFASKVHSTIKKTTEAMEQTYFRQAIQYTWFDLTNTIKQYMKLTDGNVHKELYKHAITAQIKMLHPFAPHITEEAWQQLGHTTLLAHEKWPAFDTHKINSSLETRQDLIEQLASDIRNVQQLLRITQLKGVTIILANQWKYVFTQEIKNKLEETRNVSELIKHFTAAYKEHSADIAKLVQGIVKDPSKLPSGSISQADELRAVESAKDYLQKAFGAQITVVTAEESQEQKAKNAFPGKPAILLS